MSGSSSQHRLKCLGSFTCRVTPYLEAPVSHSGLSNSYGPEPKIWKIGLTDDEYWSSEEDNDVEGVVDDAWEMHMDCELSHCEESYLLFIHYDFRFHLLNNRTRTRTRTEQDRTENWW